MTVFKMVFERYVRKERKLTTLVGASSPSRPFAQLRRISEGKVKAKVKITEADRYVHKQCNHEVTRGPQRLTRTAYNDPV